VVPVCETPRCGCSRWRNAAALGLGITLLVALAPVVPSVHTAVNLILWVTVTVTVALASLFALVVWRSRVAPPARPAPPQEPLAVPEVDRPVVRARWPEVR
jgi:uncharacterized iron-regulated membrane protein